MVNLSGLYIEFIVDRMLCLVSGLFLREIWNLKVLFMIFYFMLRICLGGSKLWFKLSFLIFFVCDLIGVDFMIFLLLDVNLWSLKLFFMYIFVLFLINLMVFCIVGIDLSLLLI